ncbi:hypothetical protein ACUUL3_13420 [Thiovibrio sp. JS02]
MIQKTKTYITLICENCQGFFQAFRPPAPCLPGFSAFLPGGLAFRVSRKFGGAAPVFQRLLRERQISCGKKCVLMIKENLFLTLRMLKKSRSGFLKLLFYHRKRS